MPVTTTFPGVYLEELPSAVRTITGVPTSITAFLGRARRGPAEEPVTIESFPEFTRIFGGLWLESTLGYAVRDFFANGGGQAIVVRLFHAKSGKPARATLSVHGLTLEAADPGAWANLLRVRIDHDVAGPDSANLFNLSVRDGSTGQVEVFRNVAAIVGHPRQVDTVLRTESRLLRMTNALSGTRPAPHADPAPGTDSWADDNIDTFTRVADGDRATDGTFLDFNDFAGPGKEANREGLFVLEETDLFNLLCIPPYREDGNVDLFLIDKAAVYAEKRRAMLLVDPPSQWTNREAARLGIEQFPRSKNAAIFFPRLRQFDPLRGDRLGEFVPCGAVAGVFARIDAKRGVWKAPAGLEATLAGVPQLRVALTDPENGVLNQLGVNCLMTKPAVGHVVWGARTLEGDDRRASEWKYIPVRRLALFLEESLFRGTQFVVFEPNDETLWAQIRLNIGAFLQRLFLQGAFQGRSPSEAYFVRCDKDTTSQSDIDRGIVNIVVGFAPLKPAEFVIIQIQQVAGQAAV
jgi:phage tail sheath protein FI